MVDDSWRKSAAKPGSSINFISCVLVFSFEYSEAEINQCFDRNASMLAFHFFVVGFLFTEVFKKFCYDVL